MSSLFVCPPRRTTLIYSRNWRAPFRSRALTKLHSNTGMRTKSPNWPPIKVPFMCLCSLCIVFVLLCFFVVFRFLFIWLMIIGWFWPKSFRFVSWSCLLCRCFNDHISCLLVFYSILSDWRDCLDRVGNEIEVYVREEKTSNMSKSTSGHMSSTWELSLLYGNKFHLT